MTDGMATARAASEPLRFNAPGGSAAPSRAQADTGGRAFSDLVDQPAGGAAPPSAHLHEGSAEEDPDASGDDPTSLKDGVLPEPLTDPMALAMPAAAAPGSAWIRDRVRGSVEAGAAPGSPAGSAARVETFVFGDALAAWPSEDTDILADGLAPEADEGPSAALPAYASAVEAGEAGDIGNNRATHRTAAGLEPGRRQNPIESLLQPELGHRGGVAEGLSRDIGPPPMLARSEAPAAYLSLAGDGRGGIAPTPAPVPTYAPDARTFPASPMSSDESGAAAAADTKPQLNKDPVIMVQDALRPHREAGVSAVGATTPPIPVDVPGPISRGPRLPKTEAGLAETGPLAHPRQEKGSRQEPISSHQEAPEQGNVRTVSARNEIADPKAYVAPLRPDGDRGWSPSTLEYTRRASDEGLLAERGFGIAPVTPQIVSGHPVASEALQAARHIARQVVDQPVLRMGGTAEVSLAPEELGHLHLSVEEGSAGLRLTIEAARPETADLLRRHVEALRQELRQEGLAGIEVSVGGGDSRRGGETAAGRPPGERRSGPDAHDSGTSRTPAPTVAPSRMRTGGGHLDLRF